MAYLLVSVSLLLVCLVCVQVTFTCSPPEGGYVEPPLSEKVYHSDAVIYGKVLRTYPDERFRYGEETTVYTAEMEVYCSLKGDPVAMRVNVTEAGFIPGHCESVDLDIGKQYVVLLRKDYETGVFSPYARQVEADLQMLDEVTIVCDMVLQYPIGVNERNRKVTCPEIAPPGDCIEHEHPEEEEVRPPSPPPGLTLAPMPPKIEDLTTMEPMEPEVEEEPQPGTKPSDDGKSMPEKDEEKSNPEVSKEPPKSEPSREQKARTVGGSGAGRLAISHIFVATLLFFVFHL